jgi:hypothetical protein
MKPNKPNKPNKPKTLQLNLRASLTRPAWTGNRLVEVGTQPNGLPIYRSLNGFNSHNHRFSLQDGKIKLGHFDPERKGFKSVEVS